MKTSLKNVLAAGIFAVAAASVADKSAYAAGYSGPDIPRHGWSFSGVRGQFDRAQLQRGFLVYKEACASCHGVTRLSFRNLSQPGGPEFPEEGVKNLAATYQVDDGPNDDGKMFKRPGILADRIPGPFANDKEARAANNGAYPPDLALITKARGYAAEKPFWMLPVAIVKDLATAYQEAGSDYLLALLKGYSEPPAYRRDGNRLVAVPESAAAGDRTLERCVAVERNAAGPDNCVKLADGMSYNPYFPGSQIAMPPPLSDGVITYTDGSPQTVAQYAQDVTAFLTWAGDPKMEERKNIGLMAILYLLITTILLYFAKKRVWSRIPH